MYFILLNTFMRMCSVIQLCLTLCDPIDCSVLGSSIHGIPQVRIPEWVAFPPPGDLQESHPRD